jgi:hypothetical protein
MTTEMLEEVAANLANPNVCKTQNWIEGAQWALNNQLSREEIKLIKKSLNFYWDQWNSSHDSNVKDWDTTQVLLKKIKENER